MDKVNTAWQMEVLVTVSEGNHTRQEWRAVKPSGNEALPYRYPSFSKAFEVLQMCYPNCIYGQQVRVKEA